MALMYEALGFKKSIDYAALEREKSVKSRAKGRRSTKMGEASVGLATVRE
jgi:hypothetical protein